MKQNFDGAFLLRASESSPGKFPLEFRIFSGFFHGTVVCELNVFLI